MVQHKEILKSDDPKTISECPPIEVWREHFSYDPDTGIITCLIGAGTRQQGQILPKSTSDGYFRLKFKYVSYRYHRVCWLLHFGAWPISEIDHKNQVRTNNRLKNLRDVSSSINAMNTSMRKDNTSGYCGIRRIPSGKWRVRITVKRQIKHVGYYYTKREAIAARKAANIKYGFHENHGRKLQPERVENDRRQETI